MLLLGRPASGPSWACWRAQGPSTTAVFRVSTIKFSRMCSSGGPRCGPAPRRSRRPTGCCFGSCFLAVSLSATSRPTADAPPRQIFSQAVLGLGQAAEQEGSPAAP